MGVVWGGRRERGVVVRPPLWRHRILRHYRSVGIGLIENNSKPTQIKRLGQYKEARAKRKRGNIVQYNQAKPWKRLENTDIDDPSPRRGVEWRQEEGLGLI